MLTPYPEAGFAYLPGIEPYSSGVAALPGYEIVQATFARPIPFRDGFLAIDRALAAAGRPASALCAVALRSPRPFSRQGFLDFNAAYLEELALRGLMPDGVNAIARTNVAPLFAVPLEPSLYAFSYTRPRAGAPLSFVVAGGGELRGGPLLTAPIVREGENSADARREKVAYVMRAMELRLQGLGASWAEATTIQLYCANVWEPVILEGVLDRLGPGAVHGVRWHPSLPPIEGIEFEMDVRGVHCEQVADP